MLAIDRQTALERKARQAQLIRLRRGDPHLVPHGDVRRVNLDRLRVVPQPFPPAVFAIRTGRLDAGQVLVREVLQVRHHVLFGAELALAEFDPQVLDERLAEQLGELVLGIVDRALLLQPQGILVHPPVARLLGLFCDGGIVRNVVVLLQAAESNHACLGGPGRLRLPQLARHALLGWLCGWVRAGRAQGQRQSRGRGGERLHYFVEGGFKGPL